MTLGFCPGRAASAFLFEQNGRATVGCDPTAVLDRADRGPGGRAHGRGFAGPGPGCGLGAAARVENRWAGPICRLDRRNSKEMNQFSFFSFSVKFYFLKIRKMQIGSKEK